MADTLPEIQTSLAEGIGILQQKTERSEMERLQHEDVELLKLLDPTSPEIKEIMADVII